MNKKSQPLRKRTNINQIDQKNQPRQIKSRKTLSRNITVTQIQPEIKSQYSESGKRKKLPQGMKQFLKSKKIQVQLKNQISQTQSLKENPQNIKRFDETIQIIQLEQVQDKKVEDKNIQTLQKGNIKITRHDVSSPRKPFNKQNFICQICEGETEVKYQISAFKCSHKYCKNCLQSYVTYKISLFEQVRCPDESCQNTLDVKCEFYDSLKKKQRKNYKKIHNFQQTKKQKDLKLCPKEDCDGIIKLKQNSKSQICEICKTQFCSECYFPLHEGACKQYQVLYLQNNFHYRQCQKCKAVVQRIQGCNHITCKCSYQFCYICGKKWKHDHLCNQTQINDDENGCDFGQSCSQHFCFLIKLPLKIVLLTLYTILFFIMSFAAAPYNLIFFVYWLSLIFFGGPFVFYDQEQRTWLQFILFFIFFPILMILCIPRGIRLFARKFSEECQCVSMGYRWIVSI